MLIKTKWIYPTFIALLLSGCGPTSNVILKYQPDQNYKLAYSLSSAPQVEVPDEVLETMRNQIEKSLSEQNLLAAKGDHKFHKAEILITHYRMRPDVARLLVGIMAGCDKIISKVTVVNSDTSNTVGVADFESNECAAWGVSAQVIKAHIEKIIDYLSNKQGGAEAISSVMEKPAPPPAGETRMGDVSRDQTKGMEMVFVAGGCYQMGDTFGAFGEADTDEKPVHEVCVDDFYIGKYEVTQSQWQVVMGNNPSYFNNCGSTCPVEQVSWDDVQVFIARLNQQTGQRYRLPTEAEWEYAARSGGKKEKYAGADGLDSIAWYKNNSGRSTHPVGKKQSNGLGIYDMSGNVWEWTQDLRSKNYYSNSPRNNPTGPSSGSHRVRRGGCWSNSPRYTRAANRGSDTPEKRLNGVGFRLVRMP